MTIITNTVYVFSLPSGCEIRMTDERDYRYLMQQKEGWQECRDALQHIVDDVKLTSQQYELCRRALSIHERT